MPLLVLGTRVATGRGLTPGVFAYDGPAHRERRRVRPCESAATTGTPAGANPGRARSAVGSRWRM